MLVGQAGPLGLASNGPRALTESSRWTLLKREKPPPFIFASMFRHYPTVLLNPTLRTQRREAPVPSFE